MKNFDEIKVLGDGAFGVVTKCYDKENHQYVAIKKMKQRYSNFEECLQEKEVKSLRKIKHENVERLLQVFRENDHLYLVFELLDESLLKTINSRKEPFSDAEVRYIMHNVFSGLAAVHKQGFFHRDMKPDNLLWSNDHVLKIADFGLAREIRSRPPYTEYISTRWYRAPEIILRHPFYNSPVDIWAAGCIMAELYMLRPLFQGTSETDQLIKISNILSPPDMQTWADGVKLIAKNRVRLPPSSGVPLSTLMPNASPEAIDLITQCLLYDPAKRPSASQAMQHRFFDGPKVQPMLASEINSTTKTSFMQAMPNFMPQRNANEETAKDTSFTMPKTIALDAHKHIGAKSALAVASHTNDFNIEQQKPLLNKMLISPRKRTILKPPVSVLNQKMLSNSVLD